MFLYSIKFVEMSTYWKFNYSKNLCFKIKIFRSDKLRPKNVFYFYLYIAQFD